MIGARFVLCALFLWGGAFPLKAGEVPVSPPPLDALRDGGMVIFFRHAATDHAQTDQDRLDLEDCETQRNLTAEGREQAKAIGRAFGAMGIPVGEVFTSPFCRCRETARLAFGRETVADFLHYAIGLNAEDRALVTKQLKKLLSSPVEQGANRIIVSHTGNLREAAGIWPKPEGVAWVFRPTEDGFAAVGRVLPTEWNRLQ